MVGVCRRRRATTSRRPRAIVFATSESVSAGVAGAVPPARGSAASGASSRGWWQLVGTARPFSQLRTAAATHGDGLDASAEWPALVTVTRCPCGKCASRARASTPGERRSSVPVTASTGTSGYGAAGVAARGGETGQPRHRTALPSVAAHDPNPPNASFGSPRIAVTSASGRCETGVSGAHGNGPSSQLVAANTGFSPFVRRLDATSTPRRRSGVGSPRPTAWTAAGSSAARPGSRTVWSTSPRNAGALSRTVRRPPPSWATLPRSGVVSREFASATTSRP